MTQGNTVSYKEIPGFFAEVFHVANDDDRFAASIIRSPQYPSANAAIEYIGNNVFTLAAAILEDDEDNLEEMYVIEKDEDTIRKVDEIRNWIDGHFSDECPFDSCVDGRVLNSSTFVEDGVDGWIVFRVQQGHIEDDFLKVYTNREDATKEVMRMAKKNMEADRYANPNHPSYDASLKDDMDAFYTQIFESIENETDYVSFNDEGTDEIHVKTIVM